MRAITPKSAGTNSSAPTLLGTANKSKPSAWWKAALGSNVRRFGWIGIIRAAASGMGYLQDLLLARWLGIGGYGVLSGAYSTANLASIPCGLGMPASMIRFMPMYLREGKIKLARGILMVTLLGSLLVGIGMLLAGSVLNEILLVPRKWALGQPFKLGLYLVPILVFQTSGLTVARALDVPIFGFAGNLLLAPSLSLAALWATHASRGELRSDQAVFLVACGTTVATIAVLGSVGLKKISTLISGPRDFRFKEWLSTGGHTLFSEICFTIQGQAEILVALLILGAASAGMYAAASRIAGLLTLGLNFAIMTSAQYYSTLHSRRGTADLQGLISRMSVLYTWPAVAGFLVIVFWHRRLLGLFGSQFESGGAVLIILAIGQLMNTVAGPVGILLNATGHHRTVASFLGMTTIIFVPTVLLMTMRFGLLGTALSVTVNRIVCYAWLAMVVRSRLGIKTLTPAWWAQ